MCPQARATLPELNTHYEMLLINLLILHQNVEWINFRKSDPAVSQIICDRLLAF